MESRPKEICRIALIAALLAGACFLGYYCQAILKIQLVFTHFYYIPIILAALWWKRKGIAVAVFLAGFLLLSNYFWGHEALLVNNFVRAAFFVAVAFVVAILEDKVEKENELLKRKENKYRTLIESIPQKIFAKDRNLTYLSCNENYAKDLRISPDEIAGKTDYDFYPRDLAEKYRADDTRIMDAAKTEEFEEEYIQDGRKSVAHAVKTAVKDNNGKVIGVLGIFWDITERKRAEEKLRESEEKFRALVETTSDWIWEVDRNGVYTYVSPKIESMLGYLPEEVVGKTPFDLMSPDEAQRIGELFAAITAERKPFVNLENTNLHKDGRLVVLETSGVPILDKNEQLIGYRGIDRDITGRKRAEEEIRLAKEKAELICKTVPSAIFTVDKEQRIISWNKKAEELTGYAGEEVLGKKCLLFALEPCTGKCGLYSEDVGKPVIGKECTIKRKDGKERIISKNADYLKDARGNVIGGIESFDDITEQKKAQEKIQRAAEEWQNTFDSIADIIFVLDKDHTIRRVNKVFLDAFKLKPEEVIGRKCYELVHKADKPWKLCPHAMTMQDNKAHTEEVDDPALGIPLLVSTSPVFDAKGGLIGSVHIAKDISAIKQNEKKLKEVQAQLIQTSKLATLGEMGAGLAHEINQPLTGIALTAKKLRKLIEKGSLTRGDAEVILKDIDGSIERVTRIIQHVRTFARQDTLKFSTVNVNEVIERALTLLNEQLRLHEIAVIKECPDNLPGISGEPYQLEQVIINIVANARDALDEKGRENIKGYSKKLVFKTAKIKDEVCISISDNGMGMADEVKGKIFQPFFTTKEVGKATGLGMSTSLGIVEAHKGRIEVESAKNAGTTVKVFLPIRMAADN